MIGWSIFGIFLGITALCLHEDRGRQILIGTTYVLPFIIAAAVSKSFAVSAMIGGTCSLAFSIWIYHNLMKREAERREQERYEREYELRQRQWEEHMNELMNS